MHGYNGHFVMCIANQLFIYNTAMAALNNAVPISNETLDFSFGWPNIFQLGKDISEFFVKFFGFNMMFDQCGIRCPLKHIPCLSKPRF
ncbi:unnamed protein product [Sphenostylis stenocarpa]|uniref:Uncharacterized protein n=1 Tax=Sphenostylis stenocarpa TaxID=92480 RepID=A0AA86SE93_9FABA|nr:unnamed protein product [Sphenostylis stenocarpa]